MVFGKVYKTCVFHQAFWVKLFLLGVFNNGLNIVQFLFQLYTTSVASTYCNINFINEEIDLWDCFIHLKHFYSSLVVLRICRNWEIRKAQLNLLPTVVLEGRLRNMPHSEYIWLYAELKTLYILLHIVPYMKCSGSNTWDKFLERCGDVWPWGCNLSSWPAR